MDLFSRKIIGWSFAGLMNISLVLNAFSMALSNRGNPKGVMFHTDRGSQYCSMEFKKVLRENNFIQSLSRRGNYWESKACLWDNACIETFFKSLKYECIYLFGILSFYETRINIFEYIEICYNRKRIHTSLGYKSPVEYEIECA
jgi:transposase InsO family protein